jgi:hypothetical protein
MQVVLISAAAAAFGGTSLLAWYPPLPRPPLATTGAPLGVARSVPWIAAAAFVMAFFVFVLGPGIGGI